MCSRGRRQPSHRLQAYNQVYLVLLSFPLHLTCSEQPGQSHLIAAFFATYDSRGIPLILVLYKKGRDESYSLFTGDLNPSSFPFKNVRLNFSELALLQKVFGTQRQTPECTD